MDQYWSTLVQQGPVRVSTKSGWLFACNVEQEKNVASLRDSEGEKTSIGHRKLDFGLHLSQAVGKHEEAVVADEVDEGQGLEELLLSLAAKADNLKGHEAKQLKNCQLAI